MRVLEPGFNAIMAFLIFFVIWGLAMCAAAITGYLWAQAENLWWFFI